MSKFFLSFIIISGLLFAFDIPAYGLIGPLMLLLIIAAGPSYLVKGKLPQNLLATLAGLIIGPVLVCCLIRALFDHSTGIDGLGLGSIPTTLILLILMAISFLYVRVRLSHLKSNQGKQLHTNERRPVLPAHDKHDGEI